MLLRSLRQTIAQQRLHLRRSLPAALPRMSSFAPASAEAGPSSRPASPLIDIRLPDLRGMKELDRGAFDVPIQVMSIRVPSEKIHGLMKHPRLRQYTLDIGKVKAISIDPDDPSSKLIRLRVLSEEQLPDDIRQLIRTECTGTRPESLVIGYDSWSTSEILNSILPKGSEGDFAPSSFTHTGHIGHLNLREEWLPYKYLIAQVLLDKNATLRTIVNKLDQINTQFRFFDMEVLAGDPDMLTTVSESNCTFTFDFSKVYWNSRLQHEHERLISLIPPGHTVADVMAGVGPFAVPLAKKGCYVLGNDLNPESVKWMRRNREINKVQRTLRVEETDGREFIRHSALAFWESPFQPYTYQTTKEKRSKRHKQTSDLKASPQTDGSARGVPVSQPITQPQVVQHFIMNLPDSALTFLDAFWGLFAPLKDDASFQEVLRLAGLPLIHVYCFTKELDPAEAERDICERASMYLGHTVSSKLHDFDLYLVRRVAPKKDMYCLTFRLPSEVATATTPHPQTSNTADEAA